MRGALQQSSSPLHQPESSMILRSTKSGDFYQLSKSHRKTNPISPAAIHLYRPVFLSEEWGVPHNIVFLWNNFVLTGQNPRWPEKVLFLPDKIFSFEKSLICFGRDFFWSNKILFGRKKAEIGSTKSFFFRTRFVWHGRDFFWLEEPVCHRKNSVWNKRSSFSTNKISFLKNEVCLYETSLVSTNEVSFVSDRSEERRV